MTVRHAVFKFTTNVPVDTRIAFVDVRPGKPWTDPTTSQTKQLPAQVSIKGTFDGVETISFLPGAAWKNLKALYEAGVIGEYEKAVEDPAEVTAIPVLDGHMRATLSKPAGAKYADMVYEPSDRPAPAPSKRIPPPSGAAPQGRTQPFDAPTRAEMAAQHDPDAPDPWDEPTPYRQTPDDDGGIIGQPPLNAREQAVLAKAQTVEEEYLALWSRVAERQASVGKSLGLPVDGSSVQAATFSIWGLSGRGR